MPSAEIFHEEAGDVRRLYDVISKLAMLNIRLVDLLCNKEIFTPFYKDRLQQKLRKPSSALFEY